MSQPNNPGEGLRRRFGAFLVDSGFKGLSKLGGILPAARPERHNLERLKDIPYQASGRSEHLLDVYRPRRPGPLPVVLYVHGGGFRILSKDSHWIMGLAFARRGYLVFNINYRLAPRYPYPAALEDVCRAYGWVLENASRFGGDPSRLVFAGESAGANLVTSLALSCSYEREEPWARAVYERGVTPRAVVAACGLFQVSDIDRFHRRQLEKNRPLPRWLRDRMEEVTEGYLGGVERRPVGAAGGYDLADPLVLLEQKIPPSRPLPPFFAPVGTRDPLLHDTRRLKEALEGLGGRCEARYYPGEVHAFHALIFRESARRCWRHTFDFLGRELTAHNS
jgi:acetyl esterase